MLAPVPGAVGGAAMSLEAAKREHRLEIQGMVEACARDEFERPAVKRAVEAFFEAAFYAGRLDAAGHYDQQHAKDDK